MNVKGLRRQVDEQERWIRKCGYTLEGYRDHYGDPDMNHCYGNGGTAIFNADVAHLEALKEKLKEAEKMPPPAKFVFHGPNKRLMKYLHNTEQMLVVNDLGGGEFSTPQFIDEINFMKLLNKTWADTSGNVTVVKVVLS